MDIGGSNPCDFHGLHGVTSWVSLPGQFVICMVIAGATHDGTLWQRMSTYFKLIVGKLECGERPEFRRDGCGTTKRFGKEIEWRMQGH